MVGLMRPRAFVQDVDSRLNSAAQLVDDVPATGSCVRRARAIVVGALLSLLFWGGLVYVLVRLI